MVRAINVSSSYFLVYKWIVFKLGKGPPSLIVEY